MSVPTSLLKTSLARTTTSNFTSNTSRSCYIAVVAIPKLRTKVSGPARKVPGHLVHPAPRGHPKRRTSYSDSNQVTCLGSRLANQNPLTSTKTPNSNRKTSMRIQKKTRKSTTGKMMTTGMRMKTIMTAKMTRTRKRLSTTLRKKTYFTRICLSHKLGKMWTLIKTCSFSQFKMPTFRWMIIIQQI